MRKADTMPGGPESGATEFVQATKKELKEAGWSPELLKQAGELLRKIAESGRFSLNIPRVTKATDNTIQLDLGDTVPAIVTLSPKDRALLKTAAAGVAAGMIAIGAGSAGAQEQRDIPKTDGPHHYELMDHTEEYTVTVNGKSVQVDPAPGFTKIEQTKGEGDKATTTYVYRSLEPSATPVSIDVPASKSAEVIIDSKTSKNNAISINGGGGEFQFIDTQNASSSLEQLRGGLTFKGALGSQETSDGTQTAEYSIPFTLMLMGNRPDEKTGPAVALYSGLAFADSRIPGTFSAQAGKMFGSFLRESPGKSGLLLLNYSKPTTLHDPLKIDAHFLAAYGSKGSADEDFSLDYRVTEATSDTEVLVGMGVGASGVTMNSSKHRLLDLLRVTLAGPTPYTDDAIKGEMTAALQEDIDTGDFGIKVGFSMNKNPSQKKKK